MRAALFGGTFNPIHKGHLMAAEQVLARLDLDRIYFIPCQVPPHKSPDYLAPATDRLAMIRQALPADQRYILSEFETRRAGPSYTIDTVAHFADKKIPGAELFLVMGLDAFLELHTWKQQQQLRRRVQPVVVTRYLDADRPSNDDAGRMRAYIDTHLSDTYAFDADRLRWQDADGNRIHLLSVAPVAASSSRIRRRIAAGASIDDLVPASVRTYIEEKELYR